MGQFSWHAQDDDRPIYSTAGHERTVWMFDNKGNSYREDSYEGYGVFGGKDFYDLLAEMNPQIPCPEGTELRDHGIRIAYGTDAPFFSPNLAHRADWTWQNRQPQSHDDQGWYSEDDDSGW